MHTDGLVQLLAGHMQLPRPVMDVGGKLGVDLVRVMWTLLLCSCLFFRNFDRVCHSLVPLSSSERLVGVNSAPVGFSASYRFMPIACLHANLNWFSPHRGRDPCRTAGVIPKISLNFLTSKPKASALTAGHSSGISPWLPAADSPHAPSADAPSPAGEPPGRCWRSVPASPSSETHWGDPPHTSPLRDSPSVSRCALESAKTCWPPAHRFPSSHTAPVEPTPARSPPPRTAAHRVLALHKQTRSRSEDGRAPLH